MSDLLQESKAGTQPTPEVENEANAEAESDIDHNLEVEDVVSEIVPEIVPEAFPEVAKQTLFLTQEEIDQQILQAYYAGRQAAKEGRISRRPQSTQTSPSTPEQSPEEQDALQRYVDERLSTLMKKKYRRSYLERRIPFDSDSSPEADPTRPTIYSEGDELVDLTSDFDESYTLTPTEEVQPQPDVCPHDGSAEEPSVSQEETNSPNEDGCNTVTDWPCAIWRPLWKPTFEVNPDQLAKVCQMFSEMQRGPSKDVGPSAQDVKPEQEVSHFTFKQGSDSFEFARNIFRCALVPLGSGIDWPCAVWRPLLKPSVYFNIDPDRLVEICQLFTKTQQSPTTDVGPSAQDVKSEPEVSYFTLKLGPGSFNPLAPGVLLRSELPPIAVWNPGDNPPFDRELARDILRCALAPPGSGLGFITSGEYNHRLWTGEDPGMYLHHLSKGLAFGRFRNRLIEIDKKKEEEEQGAGIESSAPDISSV